MLTRRLLESGKISPKVQAREGEAKQSLLLWCGNEHKTIHKRRRQRKAIQIRRGRCNCFQAACGTQQTTPCGMRCCPVFHFYPAPATAPCAFSLVVAQELALSRISQRNWIAQAAPLASIILKRNRTKQPKKWAKERKQRREGEREMERGRVEGEGAKSSVYMNEIPAYFNLDRKKNQNERRNWNRKDLEWKISTKKN